MAIQRHIKIDTSEHFPHGLMIGPSGDTGPVTPVLDFNAPPLAGGAKPQQVDKETGLPLWQVTVLDLDPEAGKRGMVFTVKIAAKHQPVPPENKSGTPFTPVEFVGLTAMPWVDSSGMGNGRIAWSFRAEGMTEPGTSRSSSNGQGTGPKAVA